MTVLAAREYGVNVEDNDTLGEEGVLLFFVKKYVIEFCVQNF
jgi:hypothetical protein